MEVGSLIGLAAANRLRGSGIARANPADHRMKRIMYGRLGVDWQNDGEDIVVPADQDLAVMPDFDGSVPEIDDMPWPGFPPDLISIALVLATQCKGTTLIHQKMFDRRLVFVDRLIDMGAGIVVCDPHRALVMGPTCAARRPAGVAGYPRGHGPGDRCAVRRRRKHDRQYRAD